MFFYEIRSALKENKLLEFISAQNFTKVKFLPIYIVYYNYKRETVRWNYNNIQFSLGILCEYIVHRLDVHIILFIKFDLNIFTSDLACFNRC